MSAQCPGSGTRCTCSVVGDEICGHGEKAVTEPFASMPGSVLAPFVCTSELSTLTRIVAPVSW
jgi:hypothetical protein